MSYIWADTTAIPNEPVFLVYRDSLVAAGLPNVYITGAGSVFGKAFWGATAGAASVGSYSLTTATIAEIVGTAFTYDGFVTPGIAAKSL